MLTYHRQKRSASSSAVLLKKAFFCFFNGCQYSYLSDTSSLDGCTAVVGVDRALNSGCLHFRVPPKSGNLQTAEPLIMCKPHLATAMGITFDQLVKTLAHFTSRREVSCDVNERSWVARAEDMGWS